MQITEKLRHDILLSLPELSVKEANRIATKTKVGQATVWRQWHKIKNNKPVFDNEVVIAILQIALRKKKANEKNHKKLHELQQQLSAA